MEDSAPSYHGYRFSLSFRDVGDLLAQRSIVVPYEPIRQWCDKFGPDYAARLKRRQGRIGDTWDLDEAFVTIRGKRPSGVATRLRTGRRCLRWSTTRLGT